MPSVLNPSNGLLLQPSYDAAFDAGLITFEDSWAIVISPQFADADLHGLGISKPAGTAPKAGNVPYLEYHR